ncbi:MAG: DUF4942 domain-containing protein [Candidatus Pacearchaeota archaeon]|jgi:hypothetical protein
MLNKDFYPTPKSLIKEMLKDIPKEDLKEKRILEPSAGKGNIVDYIEQYVAGYREPRHVDNIDCIENDPDLLATLYGKGHNVVHNDFLKFNTNTFYDYIIMNPPFQNGDEHLLHAWEIMKDGQIVCILNAETLKNPYTGKRRLLLDIIEKNGTYSYKANAFITAERKTGVEIAIVRLKKSYEFKEFEGLTDNLKLANNVEINDRPMELAIRDRLENMLSAYKGLQNGFVDIYRLFSKIKAYAEVLGKLDSHDNVVGKPFGTDRYSERNYLVEALQKCPKEAWNYFFDNVRLSAWESIFSASTIASFATQRVRDNFKKDTAKQSKFEFTRENVESFIYNLIMSKGNILNQCVVDAFDLMTSYHEKNSIHVEGWKSNKAWKINRRIILPHIVTCNKGGGYTWYSKNYNIQRLDDIDRAMCFLSGDDFEKLQAADYTSNQDAPKNLLDQAFKQLIGAGKFSGVKQESKFFEISAYYKGTGHFYFKDEKLWEKFNITAAKGKNWLPDTTAI